MKPTIQKLLVLAGFAGLTLTSCGPKGEGDKDKKPADAKSGSATPAASGGAAASAPAAKKPTGETEQLPINLDWYPKAQFVGTPVPTGDIKNLEKPDPEAVKKRDYTVPKGTTNVAKGKKVTCSDPLPPIIGSLDLVTDGDADGSDGCYVELSPGKQWIQVDLGADYDVWKILLWHFHKNTAVYFNVVVQASTDPEFKKDVVTLFNNDDENKCGQGAGKDPKYIETNHGRFIEGNGTKARYVRCWSAGNSANEMNHYVELQVYGSPAK